MEVFVFERSDTFGANMYIAREGEHALLVDPSCPPDSVPRDLLPPSVKIEYILLTHAHFDHMLEIDAWCALTGAPVVVGAADGPALSSSTLNCYWQFMKLDRGYLGEYQPVTDGDELPFADTLIEVIAAPGHTPGGVCYRICDALFVGDLVFRDHSFGRYDLPGGNFHDLRASLARFRKTEGNPTVYTGHGSHFRFLDEYNH